MLVKRVRLWLIIKPKRRSIAAVVVHGSSIRLTTVIMITVIINAPRSGMDREPARPLVLQKMDNLNSQDLYDWLLSDPLFPSPHNNRQ